MPTAFFHLIGRLGNLLFIYAFARAWCEQNDHTLCMDPWIGEKIFTIPEARRTRNADKVFPEHYYQDQASLIYTRKQVREWFTFKPEILERLQCIRSEPVLLNVRKAADHVGAGHVAISSQSYVDAARRCGYADSDWRWEMDISPTGLPDFDGDIWASGLGTTAVAVPSFYRLMTAKVLFRANSTFSFWAATLNTEGKIYSPVINGLQGGIPNVYCGSWVEGNYPMMTESTFTSDLHFSDE